MDSADKGRVESFLIKWIGSEGNERANYQGFFLDFCDALDVEKPQPKGNAADAPYCFDKDIKFYILAELKVKLLTWHYAKPIRAV